MCGVYATCNVSACICGGARRDEDEDKEACVGEGCSGPEYVVIGPRLRIQSGTAELRVLIMRLGADVQGR